MTAVLGARAHRDRGGAPARPGQRAAVPRTARWSPPCATRCWPPPRRSAAPRSSATCCATLEDRGNPVLEIVGRTAASPSTTRGWPRCAPGPRTSRSTGTRPSPPAVRRRRRRRSGGEALAVDRARSAALAGDVQTATRLADEALAHATGARAADAARVLGAAPVAFEGWKTHAAAVYRPLADAGGVAAAQLWSVCRARHRACRRAAAPSWPATGAPPSLEDGSREAMVRGVQQSLEGDGMVALPTLLESAAMLRPRGRGALLPDTPAALAALVALHCGASVHAVTTLREAIAAGLGGPSGAAAAPPAARVVLDAGRAPGRGGGRRRPSPSVRPAVGTARATSCSPARSTWSSFAGPTTWLPWCEVRAARARRASPAAAGPVRAPAARRDHRSTSSAPLGRPGDHTSSRPPCCWGVGGPVCGRSRTTGTGSRSRSWRSGPTGSSAAPGPSPPPGRATTPRSWSDAARIWLQVLGAPVEPPAVERAARRLVAVGIAWDGHGSSGARPRGRPTARRWSACCRPPRSMRPAQRNRRPRHGVAPGAGADARGEAAC